MFTLEMVMAMQQTAFWISRSPEEMVPLVCEVPFLKVQCGASIRTTWGGREGPGESANSWVLPQNLLDYNLRVCILSKHAGRVQGTLKLKLAERQLK